MPSSPSPPPSAPWVVLKFGGTSITARDRWHIIAGVLRARLDAGERPLVVHSALRGITDLLEGLPEAALRDEAAPVLEALEERHRALALELELEDGVVAEALDGELVRLRELARGMTLLREVTPRVRAEILSAGERLATRLGAAFLSREGIPVTWLDVRELLPSLPGDPDDPGSWLSAECSSASDPALQALLDGVEGIPLTQGFTARNPDGDTVVLGRGGSDTAAAYLAGRVDAQRLEIWTDVPGMFTADPRVVPSARLLKELDYREAQEVATTGSKVLHPRCIPAVRERNIPIEIHSTLTPEAEGTRIHRHAPEGPAQVKAISRKKGVVLVTMETVGMWQEVGFLSRAFTVFAEHGLSIDLISTSETSVSVSLDADANLLDKATLDRLLAELNRLCRAEVIRPCAAVSLVGRRIRGLLHRLGSAFEVFEHQRIHLLSQASSDLNLTVVVDEDQADRLVARLHEQLIARAESPGVFGARWDAAEEERAGPAPRPDAWWVGERERLLEVMEGRENAYVYHLDTVSERLAQLTALEPVDRVLYAMKANAHPDVLRRARQAGAGFECVSPGEVRRVLELFPDLPREEILFTPNFAGRAEYAFGLAEGVRTTLDSVFPLKEWPELFRDAELFVRADPGVGRGHHEKVQTAGAYSKFGVPSFELEEMARLAREAGARIVGLHAHAGSGILSPGHWEDVGSFLADAASLFPEVRTLDVGGGLGVPEKPAQPPLDLGALAEGLARVRAANPGKALWIEPGRYVVAEAGVLLTRVTQTKGKGAVQYVGVSTGMNSLLRPALYGAYHPILNLTRLHEPATERATVVGPICESGDRLGLDRLLPPSRSGDVVLIANAGAYGAVMSSRYNLREPAEEVGLG